MSKFEYEIFNSRHAIQKLVDRLKLNCTCQACPEQYDVLLDNKVVGYMRLRHGYFYVSVPHAGGDIIYDSTSMEGNGMFEEDERDDFINAGLVTISDYLISKNKLRINITIDEDW